jgi:copper chaperone CopZ
MHCISCEKLLEMDIAGLPGVGSVKANYKSGTVTVEGDKLKPAMVEKAIRESGYKI